MVGPDDARTDEEWMPATWHQLDLDAQYDDDPSPYDGTYSEE